MIWFLIIYIYLYFIIFKIIIIIKKKKSSPVDKKPQDTILINNFVRPLVTRTVKELVSQYGEVKNFWMDTIKTHAYVTVC